MTTLKRCTSCDEAKPIEKFRLRKIKAPKGVASSRVATCEKCETDKNPHKHYHKPAPLWVRAKPYRPDPESPNVQLFRRELAKRGIARVGER